MTLNSQMLFGKPFPTLELILYGSDFPNIPYAWDRASKQIMQLGLNETQLEMVLAAMLAAFTVSRKNQSKGDDLLEKAGSGRGTEDPPRAIWTPSVNRRL